MADTAPRRRRFRYRLSWLLVLLTLAGMFLGRQTYLAREQADAVQAILEAEGRVTYSYEVDAQGARLPNPQNPYPAWLRSTVGEDYFRTPENVGLSDGGRRQHFSQPSQVTPEVMAALGRLRYLKWIELSHNETVDDDALVHLARLKRLNTLYLHNTKITGIGFSPLAHLSFEYLDLSRSPVTDKGLEQISRLRRLKYLGLENCAVTDVGIVHLAALRQLQELRLTNTDVSDAALVHLEKLPKLKSLSLNSTQVSAEGVTRLAEALPNCQIHKDVNLGEVPENELLFAEGEQPTKDAIEAKLASLAVDHYLQVNKDLPDQPVTSFGLDATTLGDRPILQLVQSIPQLELLRLHNTFAGDELLAGLGEFRHLRMLNLRGGRFSAAGLGSLQHVESLQELELHAIPLTDDDVDHLAKLQQLRSLIISGSKLSNEGIQKLKRAMPGCRLTVH